MVRPNRLEYEGAVYHVTARGVNRGLIYLDDEDRGRFLKIVSRTFAACDVVAFAHCLMGNHYHLVVQTNRANLSDAMRRINTAYSMTFNRRHKRSGHVFEGRFVAFHVDRDAYLLQACRYVDLNPVRAGMVDEPEQWAWSSYRSHVGLDRRSAWLATAFLHGVLLGDEPRETKQRERAERLYADFVRAGRGLSLWKSALRDGLYVGDDVFVESVKRRIG